jgi:hypothetical protein
VSPQSGDARRFVGRFSESFFGEALAGLAVLLILAVGRWAIMANPTVAGVVLFLTAMVATGLLVPRWRSSRGARTWRSFAITLSLWIAVALAAYAATLEDR